MTERTIKSPDLTPDALRAYRAAKALHRDGGSPASVFNLLAAIVEDRTWERLTDNTGQPFKTFTAFVTAPGPAGLGTTPRSLEKVLEVEHPQERKGGTWARRAPWLRAEVGRLLREEISPTPRNGEIGRGRPNRYGATVPNKARGTVPDTVARLKRDDPALAERVVRGEVTPNAAAREKGWRHPRILLTSPAAVAERIREHFTPEEVAELRDLLA